MVKFGELKGIYKFQTKRAQELFLLQLLKNTITVTNIMVKKIAATRFNQVVRSLNIDLNIRLETENNYFSIGQNKIYKASDKLASQLVRGSQVSMVVSADAAFWKAAQRGVQHRNGEGAAAED